MSIVIDKIVFENYRQYGTGSLSFRADDNSKLSVLIAKNGTVENVDDWGKRRLAYLINDEAEGYYVFFTFESEPSFPAEFERIAKITDGVLRVMVIKK